MAWPIKSEGNWRDQITSFSPSSNLRLFPEHLELATDPGFPGTNNRPPGSAQASLAPRLLCRAPKPDLAAANSCPSPLDNWFGPCALVWSLAGWLTERMRRRRAWVLPGLIPSGHASAARSAILMVVLPAKSCILANRAVGSSGFPCLGPPFEPLDAACRKSAFRCEPNGIDIGPTPTLPCYHRHLWLKPGSLLPPGSSCCTPRCSRP